MSDDNFKFYMPVEITKSADGDMRIGGIAATEDRDAQGEIVKMEGLDISALKEGRGVFNDDHRKGFENVVGVIDHADFSDKGLYVEGLLLKNEKGRNIYEIMKHCQKNDKAPRVQMSIEGKILRRSGKDRKTIAKAKVDKIAFTLDPVNRSTYADLVKSLITDEAGQDSCMDSSESVVAKRSGDDPSPPDLNFYSSLIRIESKLDKAMSMQGGNYSDTLPQDMDGATAMSKESLDKDKKKKKKKDIKKGPLSTGTAGMPPVIAKTSDGKKEKLKDVVKSLARQYPDRDVSEIADVVITKYKETI